MKNYKLTISYDGTMFSGWQNQPKERTVQNDIENVLKKIFKNKTICLIGSGRTDSGVHALKQVANFNIATEMLNHQIQKAINSYLNDDIFIHKCRVVDTKFHSRFSAIKREYIYCITKKYSPFYRKYEWFLKNKLDLDKLEKCSEFIIGKHDFSKFCKKTSRKENNECEIFVSKWIFNNEKMQYNIIADRFLHHMVRFLVGTMVEVAKGKISLKDFQKMINNGLCDDNVFKAPARGLFLCKVFY